MKLGIFNGVLIFFNNNNKKSSEVYEWGCDYYLLNENEYKMFLLLKSQCYRVGPE